ncbi:TIGR03013 family XrtA/PEP-CTERM system glycosyltransferase [Lysobacter sp. H23M47]|uniref:TIGR03013 family XrtA/PEP-CTERM system glycosyltransferase n=1 Tax=Lysobacter sp. H23M47 TaxID=2781024 RepID=UPI001882E4CC|nr:TIGR03013 family XrtA/PEP-CTERM system glycosyltransferase [Lysobacter sp. H23M47]QOW23790.1 TIGR03013 family PEP-CTERM/XrtA system glycosyltransferase [Lysobacter sp. H23M47]
MKGISASRARRVIRGLWLMELAIVLLCVNAAVWLRFIGEPEGRAMFVQTAPFRTLLVAMVLTASMAAFALYSEHGRLDRKEFGLRLIASFAFGGIALLVIYYLVPRAYIGRGVLLLALMLGVVAVYAFRMFTRTLFGAELFKRRVLVLGAGYNAQLINTCMRRRSDRESFTIEGFVPLPGQPVVVAQEMRVESRDALWETVRARNVHEIVIAPDERRGGLPMEDMLACAQRGVRLTALPDFFEREAGLLNLNVVDPSSLIFSGGFDHSLPRRLSKRFFDLLAASALLLVAWPVMLVVALCVGLESGAPILYRQSRVGEGGRSFELAKFRSMRTDAEADGVARWASTNDNRVTRVGAFIRLTRLDELPQLFNVLRGDMSFVGPRPERPQFVAQLDEQLRYYAVRHSVKPGLTGWAQLRYPYGASVHDAGEKLKFDLFYVKNQGLLFDLMIMLQTVEVVLFRRGAR